MNVQNSYKSPRIKCPHCGAEYLPSELYLPGSLIGHTDDIVKDALGRVIYEDYDVPSHEPSMIEHFICDYCDKPFVIEATITYKTKEEAPESDFKTQYVSLID